VANAAAAAVAGSAAGADTALADAERADATNVGAYNMKATVRGRLIGMGFVPPPSGPELLAEAASCVEGDVKLAVAVVLFALANTASCAAAASDAAAENFDAAAFAATKATTWAAMHLKGQCADPASTATAAATTNYFAPLGDLDT
jgi:hypothetical protein